MALTSLPEEVLELVVDRLSATEVIACSTVSVNWRLKFNEDLFWRKFCFKGIKDYLEVIPCEVEPAFEFPKSSELSLQTLCDWRIHFMRNVHLYKNWKMERFTLTKIREYTGVPCEVMIDSAGVHWLFVKTDTEIEVWNINSSPEYYSTITLFKNCPTVNVFVTGKRLIVTQWNLSSVYDLNSNTLNVIFRFVVEGNELLPEHIFNVTDLNEFDFINGDDDFRFSCFGQVFVGYKRVPSPPSEASMHLWDLLSGEKLSTLSMTRSLRESTEISFTNIFKVDSSRGLIRSTFFRSIDEGGGLCSQLLEYNFEKLKFSKLNISVPGPIVWCGFSQNVIITFTSYPGIIRFYNYLTGKLLSVKEVGQYINTEQMQLAGSNLLYCIFNCMNVMDIHKQEIVYCLEFSFYSFVRRLTVIEPRFVVVWLLDRGGQPGCPSYSQEVWDLKDLSSKLMHFSSQSGQEMAAYSPSLVKQVISHNDMMYLYTFW